MKWYALLFLAIVIEAVITYGRTLFVDRRFQWQIAAAMLLGVGCALAFGVDLFAVAGVPAAVPYVGQVLTGILLSRGSNYVFDLIGKLTTAGQKSEQLEAMLDNEIEPVTHEETEAQANG